MALFLLFIVISINLLGVESQTTSINWQCGNGQCLCSSILIQTTDVNNSSNNSNNNSSSNSNSSNIISRGNYNNTPTNKTIAICYLKTLSDYASVSPSLPSNMMSLTVSCITQNTNKLWENMFARHPGIREINLKMCSIKYIDPKFSSGANTLTNLHFSDSVLPLFAPDTFSGIKSLISLRITSSTIVNFPYFEELKNLQLLDVSQNKVKFPGIELHNNTHNRLIDLVNVTLSYNRIRNIPSQFFSIMPNLKYLDLEGNDLSRIQIPPDMTHHLEKFTAVDNNIDFIDLKYLFSSQNLSQFRITGSGNQSLIFDGSMSFPNLLDLKLSGFKLNDSIWNIIDAPSIRKLDLSSNEVENVDLMKFPYLQRIYLQDNKLSEISSETFKQQHNLLVVNISLNNISQLPEDLFSHSSDLLGFLMKGNEITGLSSKFFSASPKLFYIDLSDNKIARFPYEIFSKTSMLLYLYIQGNRLTSLPSFSSLKSLHHLDISHNHLRFLTSVSFKGLDSLEFLIANDNQLTMIPPGLFEPCKNLLDVHFYNNKIKFIASLNNHPRITRLRLENNSLTDFTNISPFAHMQSLESVFLDQNYFQAISPNMFPPSIEIISMSQNDIIRLLVKSLNDMPRLSVINFQLSRYVISIHQSSVQRYGLDKIKPSILLNFTDLSCSCWLGYLKVWDERRYDIPQLIKRFPNFQGLENAHCVTPRYPDAFFRFKDLPLRDFVCEYTEPKCYDVVCDCCRSNDTCPCVYTCPEECQCFEGGSSFWKHYVHIVCRDRNLTRVPDLIPPLANFVHLDGNSLSTLKKIDLSHLTHVEELYLNNSGIISIDEGIFDGMSQIQIINLSDNLMTNVDSNTFGNITSLIHLDLSNNEINQIQPDSFDGLINLQTLHLNNNRLKYLSNNVLEIPNLHSRTLAFNPWSCDCTVIENFSSYVLRRENAAIIKDRAFICCQFDSVHSQQTFFRSIQNISTSLDQDIIPVSHPRIFNGSSDVLAKFISKNSSNDITNVSSLNDTIGYPNPNGVPFHQMDDVANVSCFPLINFNFERACEAVINMTLIVSKSPSSYGAEISPEISIGLVVTATILVLCIIFLALFTWRRSELVAVLYAKTGVRVLDKKANIDKKEKGTKHFDAFISYSQKDHDFVCNSLVPDLEKNGYQVCVHYRDFPVGGNISDVIRRAIHLSSRTILIVSRHFLESNWCRYEFQTAHHHILKEGSHRLILVLMEDIPEEDMDPDFRTHMKINTYLKAHDAWFWEKLRFALPDVSKRKHGNMEGDDNNLMMRGMRILSKMENCTDDDSNYVGGDGGNQEKVEGLNKIKMNEGGEEDGGMKEKENRKIDWKKEEERILNERRYVLDIMLNDGGKKEVYVIGDGEIGFDWMNNVNAMYANT